MKGYLFALRVPCWEGNRFICNAYFLREPNGRDIPVTRDQYLDYISGKIKDQPDAPPHNPVDPQGIPPHVLRSLARGYPRW